MAKPKIAIIGKPKPCRYCEYVLAVSNHSPCYSCKSGDKFKEAKREKLNDRLQ